MEAKEKQRDSVIWALERIKENYKEGELLTLHFDIDRLNLLIEFLQSSEWVKVELEKLKSDLEELKAKRTCEVDVDSMICILRDILTPPNR